MDRTPDEKPVFRFFSNVEIESGRHGVLRFTNWTAKAGAAIDKVCNADLTPRRFAEDLYVQLATDPLLTDADVQQWTDLELLDVAVEWWNVVEHRRPSRIPFNSLDEFQNAVRQRSSEHKKSVTFSIENMALLHFRRPEQNAIERLTEGVAKHHRMLAGLTGQSEIQRLFEQKWFDTQSPRVAALREMTFSRPERLALESVHERMREAQLFAPSQVASFGAVRSSLADYATQAERMHREMGERLRVYEGAFDASRLKAALSDLDLTAYKRLMPNVTGLESLAASLKSPWIDRLRPEVSVVSLARMSVVSAAAQIANPFAVDSVTTIRKALGDWREITMPWRLLPDTNLREQFYMDRGFDTNLVQLPEPAFSEALHNLGLVRGPTSSEAEQIDQEEILRGRMARVYKLLFRLERGLRAYIDRVMIQKYGDDWERYRCHGNGQIYKKWVQKRDLAVKSGLQPQRLIQYADFTEYADLITKADNWKEVFQEAFDRPEGVRESFHRLGPVRLCTMHARAITKTELMLAIAEVTRLLIAIGDIDGHEDAD